MSRIAGNVYFDGTLSAKAIALPDSTVDDDAIKPGAPGGYVDPTKLGHVHRPAVAQPNTAAVTETRPLFVCFGGAGLVADFRVGLIAPNTGAATVAVDLRKNGVSILSAPVTLNSAVPARTALAGAVSDSGLVAGDWLDVVVTATAGGGGLGTGLLCQATIHEDPQ